MARPQLAKDIQVTLIQFPGSNCDWDCLDSLQRKYQIDVNVVWHDETQLPKTDAIILPGGFSYGDYLRGGALAAGSPIVREVKSFAKSGGPIIGICNGFQVLTETQLLPGVLLKNELGRFICRNVDLSVNETVHCQTSLKEHNEPLNIPIAHGEGRYFIDQDGHQSLRDKGQILLQYVDNPNGSVGSIAGIVSENGRIWGMMPHPERATDRIMGGSEDGIAIWNAFFEACM